MENKSVLIVDDDSDDQEFFTSVINEINPAIEVRVTDSKSGMFTELDKSLPDLIFMDSLIQNESGVAGIRQLKSSPELKQIPVIMYTGSSDDRNVTTAFEAGAVGYITKPDTYAAIKKVMQQVLYRNWENPGLKPVIYNGNEFIDYQ